MLRLILDVDLDINSNFNFNSFVAVIDGLKQ